MNKIYLKLLTTPKTDNLSVESKEYENFAAKHNPEQTLDAGEVLDMYYNEAGKNPKYAKVHTITMGFVDEGIARIQVLKGAEKDILTEMLNLLRSEHFKSSTFCAWNFDFVLPFITTRMFTNGFSIKDCTPHINHLGKRPWDLKNHTDIQALVEGIGWFKGTYNEWIEVLGITTDTIDGKDVYKFLKSGKEAEVIQSEIDYLYGLIQIEHKVQGEELPHDLKFTIKELEVVEKKEDPLYQRIMNTQSISKEDEKLIRQMAKSLTTEENLLFSTNLRAALGKSDKKLLKKEVKLFEFLENA